MIEKFRVNDLSIEYNQESELITIKDGCHGILLTERELRNINDQIQEIIQKDGGK